MHKLTELRFLFSVVAVIEWMYAVAGICIPPGMTLTLTGWVLNADGQWLARILGVALASQAWVAWTLRNSPHVGVAKALAFYQIGSATADWAMWLLLADEGIFSTTLGKVGAAASIPLHYSIGVLLLLAIRRQNVETAGHP
jgi:hypothetical protein